jgi:transcriptional regulator with XRE-family HTH domain
MMGSVPATLNTPPPAGPQSLGAYLKSARSALGLSLRAVEERTGKAVTNGYLSQIESGTVTQPSPNMLYHLARAYDLDYGDLLVRAGHRVPHNDDTTQRGILAGFPMHAVEELTESERSELLEYIAFLRSKRPSSRGR